MWFSSHIIYILLCMDLLVVADASVPNIKLHIFKPHKLKIMQSFASCLGTYQLPGSCKVFRIATYLLRPWIWSPKDESDPISRILSILLYDRKDEIESTKNNEYLAKFWHKHLNWFGMFWFFNAFCVYLFQTKNKFSFCYH